MACSAMPSMGRNPTSPSPAQFRMQTALLVGLLMSLILNGCATPSRETQVSADSVEQIRLSWEAPTTRTDGTPLTDIAGFTLYYGLASGEYAFLKALGSQTTAAVSGLEPGETYYFAVTAFDHAGNESRFSNEATVTAPLSVGRTPMLTQDPLRRGQTSHFRVRGAEPNEVVSFLFGTTGEGEGPVPHNSAGCASIFSSRASLGRRRRTPPARPSSPTPFPPMHRLGKLSPFRPSSSAAPGAPPRSKAIRSRRESWRHSWLACWRSNTTPMVGLSQPFSARSPAICGQILLCAQGIVK
jgi:Fibronectin type III domain